MRVLALALFVVAAATCCLADKIEVVELERLAEQVGAPFTRASREMLEESGLWGANRANRTSDIVIMNASNQPFQLSQTNCVMGKLTKGLQPEQNFNAKASIVYGLESTLYLRGVQCTTLYESSLSRGSWFSLMVHVPFLGDNVAYAFSSEDLYIRARVSSGNNNQIIFTVKDGSRKLQSSGSAQDGVVSMKKSKGNRNKFYRTSKSGSRSHQL